MHLVCMCTVSESGKVKDDSIIRRTNQQEMSSTHDVSMNTMYTQKQKNAQVMTSILHRYSVHLSKPCFSVFLVTNEFGGNL